MTDLLQFIALLDSHSQIHRIPVPTDPVLEIAAITDQVCKGRGGGPALLFESPIGSSFPVATNLFGSLYRICLALGLQHLDELTEKVTALVQDLPRLEPDRLDRDLARLPQFLRNAPRITEAFADQHHCLAPDLSIFPFLQTWPRDGSAAGHSRYITLPLVITADPDGDTRNCGIYRAQVRGKKELGLRWKRGSGADRHLDAFRRKGEKMPVAIALGGDPAATFSALCPLPGDLDEMTFAGFMRGAPLQMVACRSVPLIVPAGCEVVIEGYVDPGETVLEGPYGNHTGAYTPAGSAALLRVTAISHRPKAIVPATVIGPPPMEDCWMAKVWERVLLSLLRRMIPEIKELCFPLAWIFHQSAIISLENARPGVVRETAELLWQTPWFSAARLLVFVDAADSTDLNSVAWRCINVPELSDDIFFDRTKKRMAVDATGGHNFAERLAGDRTVLTRVAQRWRSYGL